MDKRLVSGADFVRQWQATECTLESSIAHTRDGKPVLHWHVPVDYLHGEPKYLIGWPRITLVIKDPKDRDWNGWEYLQAWIYCDTTRDALPAAEPASLTVQSPDRAHAMHMTLSELAKGKWALISIPLSQLSGTGDVRMVQFNISESRYHHLDQVDFYIADLSLVRYAQPTILRLAAESQFAYCDDGYVPVRFELRGVAPGQTAQVACELLREGHVVAALTGKAAPGANRLAIDVSKAKLGEGEYELQARIGNTAAVVGPPIKLVQSPWQ